MSVNRRRILDYGIGRGTVSIMADFRMSPLFVHLVGHGRGDYRRSGVTRIHRRERPDQWRAVNGATLGYDPLNP